MRNLPDSLNAKALARLLSPLIQKSETTILRDISRKPTSLPAPEICSGKKIWWTEAVLEWRPSSLRVSARRSLGEDCKETRPVHYPPQVPSLADMLLAVSPTAKNGSIFGGKS